MPEFSGCKWNPEIEKDLIRDVVGLDKKLIIFGAGYNGRRVLQLVYAGGGIVEYFCDNNKKKHHTMIDGVEVISIEELLSREVVDDLVFIISPMLPEGYNAIFDLLIRHDILVSNIFKLSDYNYMKELNESQYFDEVLSFGRDEIFIDAGSYDFFTSCLFIKRMNNLGFGYKKIYAFEPDVANFRNCQKKIENLGLNNISLINAGLWSTNTELQFNSLANAGSFIEKARIQDDTFEGLKNLNINSEKLKVVSLDSCIKEKVTFIKMDIEGAEIEALKGAKNILIRDKPKLAICIYHKKEDLWEIPYYIKNLVPEYKLYIRHYSNYAHETVLYAVCEGEM